jgi:hypothetical protein
MLTASVTWIRTQQEKPASQREKLKYFKNVYRYTILRQIVIVTQGCSIPSRCENERVVTSSYLYLRHFERDNFIMAESSAKISTNYCYSGERFLVYLPLTYLPIFFLRLAIIRAYYGRKYDTVLKINHYHLLFIKKAGQVTNKCFSEIRNTKLLSWRAFRLTKVMPIYISVFEMRWWVIQWSACSTPHWPRLQSRSRKRFKPGTG